MAKVELKKPVVDEISEVIKDAQGVVLVDYRGLTVEQDTALRRALREAGVSYKVFKNTLFCLGEQSQTNRCIFRIHFHNQFPFINIIKTFRNFKR